MTRGWQHLLACRCRAVRCFTTTAPRREIRDIAELPPRVYPGFRGECEKRFGKTCERVV